jgi:hypothetical protein
LILKYLPYDRATTGRNLQEIMLHLPNR